MLDKAQLTQLFDRHGTPPAGRQLILDARIQAPVRTVESRGGNVITILDSRKMGREIATESRHIEFVAAIGMEYDDRVLEFYPQPCERRFEFIDAATGEVHSHRHIPDFLTIRADGFTLEEWKSEAKLERLAQRQPYRYVKDRDGLWRSPQIEEQLAALGIHYRICSDAAISRRRVENLLYLEDYFQPAAEQCPDDALAVLRAALKEHGYLHTEYIHNLAGNTKATKNVRSVTGSHLPEKLAEWNLQELYYGIQYWATEYYDQERHPALDESPRDAFQRGLRESGVREQKHILFNRDFLIATCPPVDRTGTRLVNRQRGVKVGERFYWSEAFRASNVAGETFPVRYDPWDASSVYVWVKDQWHQAFCRALLGLGQLTEVEQKLVSQEFHRRTKTKETDPQARQRLREFLQVFTPKGAMAMELERQAENKSLYNSLQLASITPVPQSPRFSLTEETSSAVDLPAEQRSTTPNPSTPLYEATGLDDSFDFDDF